MRQIPLGIKALSALAVLMTIGAGVAWAVVGKVGNGQFVSACLPSHMKSDDPIVYPNKPGWSHRHQFFGAKSTDAFTKPQAIRGGATSCDRPEDTAAYWIPTLTVNGRTVKPMWANVYYLDGNKDRKSIRPFPPGLRMIAGNAGATHPQPVDRVTWACVAPLPGTSKYDFPAGWLVFASGFHQKYGTKRPYCPKREGTVALAIRFPDCWDGRNLDSPNHRSHVRYAKPGPGLYVACPASHPVPLPAILFIVDYDTQGSPNPRETALSSGSVHSGHADFMNAWNQAGLDRLVRDCINNPPCWER